MQQVLSTLVNAQLHGLEVDVKPVILTTIVLAVMKRITRVCVRPTMACLRRFLKHYILNQVYEVVQNVYLIFANVEIFKLFPTLRQY